jgi:hypothetical protein
MKTKTLLLLCLFIVIGLTQVFAQNGKDANGTIHFEFSVPQLPSPLPVLCDGVLVDELNGIDFNLKGTAHYDKGELVWIHNVVSNATFLSVNSGEMFKINLHEKYFPITGLDFINLNANGNLGNHYLIHLFWDNLWNLTAHGTCH